MQHIIYAFILLFFFPLTPRAQQAIVPHHRHAFLKSEQERHLKKKNPRPPVSYPGDQNIDVTYYKLDLTVTVNPEPNYLRGIVTVRGRSAVSDLSAISLDLVHSLTVDSVISPSGKLAFTQTPATLLIRPVHALAMHEGFEVQIYYRGVPGSGSFGGLFFGVGRVFTMSESYNAPLWWPCKDDPKDKADSADIWITCREAYKVGSNGILSDTLNYGNGLHTYRWKVSYPIAPYLIAFAMADYTEYRDYYRYGASDSLLILNYLYGATSPAIAKTATMMGIFSDLFGDYPFLREKYGHCQFEWGGAMEHQTMTFLTNPDDEFTVSHELAHQWFGNMITCRDWHHIWINEGFAMYASALYLERAYGSEAYWEEMRDNLQSAKAATGSVWIQDISNEWKIFDWNRTYAKGSCILHMLRHVTGDSVFFRILRAFAEHPDYRYQSATADDFRNVCERVTGTDLDYFFQEWIYGYNYPVYHYGWETSVWEDRYRLRLRIKQDVNTATPFFFTMPVDVGLYYESGGDTILRVFNNQQEQYFTFILPEKPARVALDPSHWILRNVYTIPFSDDTTFSGFELLANYPNPFNQGTVIAFTAARPARTEIWIYNALGHKVRKLFMGICEPGKTLLTWDGRDAWGRPAASGVYFCRLSANRHHQTRKMALVR